MYSKLLNMLLRSYYNAKHRRIFTYLSTLNETQWLSRQELLDRQFHSLKSLLTHANQFCPYYNRLFHLNGFDPEKMKSFDELSNIPILTKDIINSRQKDLLATPYFPKLLNKSTGGSTGEPLWFQYNIDSDDWRVACSLRGYSWSGCTPGKRQAYLWGVNLVRQSEWKRLKEALHHALIRQRYYNCFSFSRFFFENTLIPQLSVYKPEFIIGYTNPVYEFSLSLKDCGIVLPFAPSSIITAAESLHDFQRKVIESTLSAPVFNTYGSREFMLIASECDRHNGLHINMENIYLEVLNDDGTPTAPGKTGEIVITDLHNYGMPFIRYKIGDLGILSDTQCACGRGLPLLQKVVGRSLDMLTTPDGRMVPGEFFPHLLKDFKEVERFQVTQNNPHTIELKLVLRNDLTPENQLDMDRCIKKVFGENIRLVTTICDSIPLTKTGKHRVTIRNF